MSGKPSPLILIDGSSYLFRAYHALPPLTTRGGRATGAVKGVIAMIRVLVKIYPDSYMAVVFDAKGPTFRNELYKEYKATRPPMPDDLRTQIKPIHRIVQAMGLPLLVREGVEADDVIGTLSRQAWESAIPTLISTGDKDMAQLVNKHVTLLNTMTNETLNAVGVEKKFGLPPERIIDYLALMGDKSDNIPGVPGAGPKTAVKWLQEYGSLDNLLAHAGEIKGKIGERLRENVEQVKLSRDLATIRLNVELDVTPQDLARREPDKPALLSLFRELEFAAWIKELEAEGIEVPAGVAGESSPAGRLSPEGRAPAGKVNEGKVAPEEQGDLIPPHPDSVSASQNTDPDPDPESAAYITVTTQDALEALAKNLRQAGTFGFSLETDGGHYKTARIISLSAAWAPGRAAYVPLGHDYVGAPHQLDVEQVFAVLRPLFEDHTLFKTGHDLKLCAHVLLNHGVRLEGGRFDVMLQSYVLNSVAHRHSLDKLAEYYLETRTRPLEDLLGKGRNKLAYAQVGIEEAAEWSAGNADFCLRLAALLDSRLKAEGALAEVYHHFEIALVSVLTRMEEDGIKVDPAVLAEQSRHLAGRLEELEREAHALAREPFNLSSPAQLQKLFYEKLKYPVLAKTAKGQPSTAEPVLQELALEHDLPRVILEHRGLSKLKSTYTDKLPLQMNPQTGRIHSTFQQAVAATGRLSSTEPNLQNIPIRTEEGRRVRRAFVAGPGNLLMSADYSQVELRIMAHLSGDKGLLKAFSRGLDVHRAAAAEIFGMALEAVTPQQRRAAKAINFGLIYGMSAYGLTNQLGIGRKEAQEYVDRYFERYPGVREYMDKTKELAARQSFVETLFGRRLYLPDIKAANGMLRRAAERAAINAPMQGTAADIIKQAMVDIGHWLESEQLNARMVLQVHDELIFEVAEQDLDLLAEGVKFRMISAASLDVPLVVDIGAGPNWAEAH